MTHLIDGYNLMHAAGLASREMPGPQFERARTRFLDWLADRVKGRAVQFRVVFDAQQAPSPSLETLHRGIRVRFAFRKTADDVIEELIAVMHKPATVTVVSNDGRVREAGRRGECLVSTCEEFIDWLIHPPVETDPDAPPPPEDKPLAPVTPADMDDWLNAFNTPKPKR